MCEPVPVLVARKGLGDGHAGIGVGIHAHVEPIHERIVEELCIGGEATDSARGPHAQRDNATTLARPTARKYLEKKLGVRAWSFHAFRVLFSRLVPDSEYGPDTPDLGTAFRPSASSHDPRYPSGRSRLLMLGSLLGIAALGGLGFLGWWTYEGMQRDNLNEANRARLTAMTKAAADAVVPAGKSFICDKSVSSPHDLLFATRGPADIDRPGLYDPNEAFELSGGSPTIVSPHSKAPYLVMGDVQSLSGAPKGERIVTTTIKVLDTQSLKVVCSGQVTRKFEDKASYAVSTAISNVLLASMCKNENDATCKAALEPVVEQRPEAARTPDAGTGILEVKVEPSAALPTRKKAAATSETSGAGKGGLPAGVVQRIVRQNFGRFRLCYENGRRKNPKLEGRVSVKFVIDRSGAVSNAANGGSDLPDQEVIACVVRSFAGLSFPAPDDGKATTINYPIKLSPGD